MIFWILTTPRLGSNFVTGEIWRRIGGEPRGMEFFDKKAVASHEDFAPGPAPTGNGRAARDQLRLVGRTDGEVRRRIRV
jgi:hypothetical protein